VPIGGDSPETGVRIVIQREKSRPDPPWEYAGAAHLPDASFPIDVRVDAGGEVSVSISPSEVTGAQIPPDLSEKVRLIVRTAYRQAKADGEAPAWRIVRWRGEK
jgi:hypothetical protein